MDTKTNEPLNKVNGNAINDFTNALLINTVVKNLSKDDLDEFKSLILENDVSKSEEFILNKLPNIKTLVENRVREIFK